MREDYDRAVRALHRLPPKLRQAVVLRFLEGLSGPEVAAALGVPEATVRTRVYHARRKLRAWLDEDTP